MTDPLIEIAEEMDAIGSSSVRATTANENYGWSKRIRAWIEANKESPQRKAFYEAAKNYFAQLRDGGSHLASMHLLAEKLVADAAYHALVESERGESEGR